MNENEFERTARAWLEDGPNRMSDRAVLAALEGIHTTRQRRTMWPAWRSSPVSTFARVAVAAVLVAAVGLLAVNVVPRLGSAPSVGASPAPVELIARGTFVEHDWGLVEMEATRQGSVVAGHMIVGKDRGEAGFPITVDLNCARTTEDGAVLIGGHVTDVGPGAPILVKEGANALVEFTLGSPHEGVVGVGLGIQPVLDCNGLLDDWLASSGRWSCACSGRPTPFLDEASVEFGPGAIRSPSGPNSSSSPSPSAPSSPAAEETFDLALTKEFVSATNGFRQMTIARSGVTPATAPWTPPQPLKNAYGEPGPFYDIVETGLGAAFNVTSTVIPNGVALDEWIDQAVASAASTSTCMLPRAQQAAISIDGQPGRVSEGCAHQFVATVVAGGRLYVFELIHGWDNEADARAFFDSWLATVRLTPETAAPPSSAPPSR